MQLCSSLTMASTALFYLLLCSPQLTFAHEHRTPHHSNWLFPRSSTSSTRNIPPEGYYNPASSGGSMLTQVPGTFPEGQGEPINAILSANSDSRVLVDADTNGGLRNYFLSFGFSGECLGQHSGSDQAANLGDGNGYLNETSVIRWNYGDPSFGSCKETVQGGNHFRYWIQNGKNADSGAIFMAVSYELPIALQHDIIPNGYTFGRDWLVGNITNSVIPGNLTNNTQFTGTTSSDGYTYETNILYLSGLLPNTSDGINHNITVGQLDGRPVNASDGLVAILDVKIIVAPAQASSKSSAIQNSLQLPSICILVSLLSLFTLL